MDGNMNDLNDSNQLQIPQNTSNNFDTFGETAPHLEEPVTTEEDQQTTKTTENDDSTGEMIVEVSTTAEQIAINAPIEEEESVVISQSVEPIDQQRPPLPTTHMEAEEDDVYEFKSSPEDNTIAINSERVTTAITTSTSYGMSRYGLDEEADFSGDEGNLIVDEGMELDESKPPTAEEQKRCLTKPALPTFEIERCDDDEEDEGQSNENHECRKVPPLRISLNKNAEGDSKTLSPSIGEGQNATPNRKRRGTRKIIGANEKRPGASSTSTRLTRGQLAKQIVSNNNESGGLARKKPRAALRRNAEASPAIATSSPANNARALTPKRGERELSQAPSTSSAIQGDKPGLSMPPSPAEGNSRSSGGAAAITEIDPSLNLQPERLSDEVTNLFNHSDIGAYTGLRKMIHQRWARDFREHQMQEWTPIKCKSSLQKQLNKMISLRTPKTSFPKQDALSAELSINHLSRQYQLRKKHYGERRRLSEFIEREYKRQLNDLPSRSRTVITCMRVLADNDIYNGNLMDINTNESNKLQPRSKDEVISQVRPKMEILANTVLKRHQLEADCLYFEQCSEWENFTYNQLPINKRKQTDEVIIRKGVKKIKTKQVNLDRILR